MDRVGLSRKEGIMLYTIIAGVIFGFALALSTVYYWVLPFTFFAVAIGIGLWAALTDAKEDLE